MPNARIQPRAEDRRLERLVRAQSPARYLWLALLRGGIEAANNVWNRRFSATGPVNDNRAKTEDSSQNALVDVEAFNLAVI